MEVNEPTVLAGGWLKSSYSASNAGQCVEVKHSTCHLVRDSKIADSPVLGFSPEAFAALAAALKHQR